MKTQKISKVLASSLAATLAVAAQVQANGWETRKAADTSRIEELEEQLRALKQELADLKAHEQAHHQEMMELEEWKKQFTPVHPGHENLLFFRGGYARMMTDRAQDILPSPGTSKGHGQNGFYIGAGFEHNLSHDIFGLTEGTVLEGTDLLGEVMFEYKRFAQGKGLLTDADEGGVVSPLAPASKQENSTVTQFTLSAAPKIRFLRDSVVRPWIIPFGFALHVISPPSDGVTVLNPGLMFGVGTEVNLWENLYAGVDFRYHVTPGGESSLSGVEDTDTDGLTAGGYVGFGF
ncbi:MAG: porin family protein [Methylohalobius sp.]